MYIIFYVYYKNKIFILLLILYPYINCIIIAKNENKLASNYG